MNVVWMVPSWKVQRKERKAEKAMIFQSSLLSKSPNGLHTSLSRIPSLCSLSSVFPLDLYFYSRRLQQDSCSWSVSLLVIEDCQSVSSSLL